MTEGHELWVSFFAKKDPASLSWPLIQLEYLASNDPFIRLNLNTGEVLAGGSVPPTAEFSIDLGDQWLVGFRHTVPVGETQARIRVSAARGFAASFPATDAAATGSVTVYGARIEDPLLTAALRDTLAPGNLLPGPSYLTWSPVGGAILTTGQTDPAGGTNAIKIEDTSGGAWQQGRTISVPYAGGGAVRFSAFVKKDPTAVLSELRLLYSTGTYVRAQINPATGAVQTWGTPPAEPADEISAIDLGSWWKLTALHSGDALATSVRLDAFPAIQGAVNVGSWTIYGARIELL